MTYDDWVKAIKRGFTKKETLDGLSEDTCWMGSPTEMMTRPANPKEKCENCGRRLKKGEVVSILTAGNIKYHCNKCIKLAIDKLISQCPQAYLGSFEEYKEWKKKYDQMDRN